MSQSCVGQVLFTLSSRTIVINNSYYIYSYYVYVQVFHAVAVLFYAIASKCTYSTEDLFELIVIIFIIIFLIALYYFFNCPW